MKSILIGVFGFLLVSSNSFATVPGGIETNSYPQVKKIRNSSRSKPVCSSTRVGVGTILLAGHCSEYISAYDQGMPWYSQVAYVDVELKKDHWISGHTFFVGGSHYTNKDLGILLYNEPKNFKEYAAVIGTHAPKAKDPIFILGFGQNDPKAWLSKGSGVLRYGTNTIDDVDEGFIHFHGAYPTHSFFRTLSPNGINATTALGDSGGPVFNMQGYLIGVHSTMAVGDIIKNSSIDLTSKSSIEFLSAAVRMGADIYGFKPIQIDNPENYLHTIKLEPNPN